MATKFDPNGMPVAVLLYQGTYYPVVVRSMELTHHTPMGGCERLEARLEGEVVLSDRNAMTVASRATSREWAQIVEAGKAGKDEVRLLEAK